MWSIGSWIEIQAHPLAFHLYIVLSSLSLWGYKTRTSIWPAVFCSQVKKRETLLFAGEMSGALFLTQKAVAASPARNGGAAGSYGSAEQAGPACFNSPVKERLSAFSTFISSFEKPLESSTAISLCQVCTFMWGWTAQISWFSFF